MKTLTSVTRNVKLVPALGALVLAVIAIPSAMAQCGVSTKLVKPSSWQPQTGGVQITRAALGKPDDDAPSIVGMWHVVFTANSLNGGTIPDTVIDNSVVVWHSDGTEIMNSSRPAQDGNFCLGVWAQTGRLSYYLNHLPWQGNDLTNAPSGIGNPQLGVQLIEEVNLSPDGSHYSGMFTLTAYDASGNPTVAFSGNLAATRITTKTKITDLL
jgi:hypothetical protein